MSKFNKAVSTSNSYASWIERILKLKGMLFVGVGGTVSSGFSFFSPITSIIGTPLTLFLFFCVGIILFLIMLILFNQRSKQQPVETFVEFLLESDNKLIDYSINNIRYHFFTYNAQINDKKAYYPT
jgi:hypothetical protein